MSEIETKIAAFLGKFEADLDAVESSLKFLLDPKSIDEISEEAAEDKKAVPYVLSAYALSSMLFAYFRQEGKDTALLMPELARVQKKIQSLNDTPNEELAPADEPRSTSKTLSANKTPRSHIRFGSSDSKKPKSSKSAPIGSKIEKAASNRKKRVSRKDAEHA